MKNGQPSIAVIMLTGTSAGLMTMRDTVSHNIKTIAPAKADEGISIRWSEPTNSLIMCGIIRPMNPIMPVMETAAAVIKDTQASKIFFRVSISTPRC